MLARIELSSETLVVRVEGAERLWALKSRLKIPVHNVVGAQRAADEACERLHGIRVGEAHVPGVVSAGRFYSHGPPVFWDAHEAQNPIDIELRDERYARPVLKVEHQTEPARFQRAAAAAPAGIA